MICSVICKKLKDIKLKTLSYIFEWRYFQSRKVEKLLTYPDIENMFRRY